MGHKSAEQSFHFLIEEKLLHINSFVNPNRDTVKGAIALANALADKRSVKLISLKKADHWSFSLDERVKLVSFGSKSWGHKVRAYRDLLEDSGGRAGSVSISLCFPLI